MCADTSFGPYLLCYNFCLISERMFFIKINFPNNLKKKNYQSFMFYIQKIFFFRMSNPVTLLHLSEKMVSPVADTVKATEAVPECLQKH